MFVVEQSIIAQVRVRVIDRLTAPAISMDSRIEPGRVRFE
jgi:hypothetical protein